MRMEPLTLVMEPQNPRENTWHFSPKHAGLFEWQVHSDKQSMESMQVSLLFLMSPLGVEMVNNVSIYSSRAWFQMNRGSLCLLSACFRLSSSCTRQHCMCSDAESSTACRAWLFLTFSLVNKRKEIKSWLTLWSEDLALDTFFLLEYHCSINQNLQICPRLATTLRSNYRDLSTANHIKECKIVGLHWICQKVVSQMKTHPKSTSFCFQCTTPQLSNICFTVSLNITA